MYLSVPEDNSSDTNDTRAHNYDMYAEYDPIKDPAKKWKPWSIDFAKDFATIETEIFISKERLSDGQSLNLIIVYTPYKSMFL